MKLELDFTNKTITLLEDVNPVKLLEHLVGLFDDEVENWTVVGQKQTLDINIPPYTLPRDTTNPWSPFQPNTSPPFTPEPPYTQIYYSTNTKEGED